MQVEFTIVDKKYKVPDVVTCSQFEKAMAWNIENDNELKPFVSQLIDVPLADLNRLDDEVFGIICGICISRISQTDGEPHQEIEGHSLLDFSQLTFGNLIDIDTYMTHSVTQNVSRLASIIYNCEEQVAADWPINTVWPAIVSLSHWRNAVYKEYDEFFELSTADAEQDGGSVNIELMWYQTCLVLADYEFLKIHKVVQRPYKEALNFLTWKKSEVQKQKLEMLKQKNKLRK